MKEQMGNLQCGGWWDCIEAQPGHLPEVMNRCSVSMSSVRLVSTGWKDRGGRGGGDPVCPAVLCLLSRSPDGTPTP